ncbi:MAG: ABC transporter permease [Candidatus Nanopelagicales bacterium]|jgi:ABC-2 type transport system permease protein
MSTPVIQAPSRLGLLARQARFDTRQTLANGEQLLLTVLIPIGLLFGLVWATGIPVDAGVDNAADYPRVALVLPGVLTVAVLSSAFASLAIATGFDRRSGSLLLLATTPLSRVDLVISRAMSTVLIVATQTLLLGAVAIGLGWRPDLGDIAALGYLLIGTVSLAACAIALAGLLRAEATLALANGVFLVLLVAGGTALPAAALPDAIGSIARVLPSGALGDGLRGTMLDAPTNLGLVAVILIVWFVGAGVLAKRTFRWD